MTTNKSRISTRLVRQLISKNIPVYGNTGIMNLYLVSDVPRVPYIYCLRVFLQKAGDIHRCINISIEIRK